MMSPSTSPVMFARIPHTHTGVCVLLSVEYIVFGSMIRIEFFILNKILVMDRSSSEKSDSEVSHVLFEVVSLDDLYLPPSSTASTSNTNNVVDENSTGDVATNKFMATHIDPKLWEQRLQDDRCKKKVLPQKTYLQSTIPPTTPKDNLLFYYHLCSIAIDFLKKLYVEKEMDCGWAKIPKNKTDIKLKISERTVPIRSFSILI